MRKYILGFIACFAVFFSKAQIEQPASWAFDISESDLSVGVEVDLIFKVTVEKDWYIYSSDFILEPGPIPTSIEFDKNDSYELVGELKAINPKKKYDDIFEGEYTYFNGYGEFRQRVKILSENPIIKGIYNYQVCSDVDGKCIPFEEDFSFDQLKVSQSAVEEQDDNSSFQTQNAIDQSLSEEPIELSKNKGVLHPVKWTVTPGSDDYNVGDEVDLIFTATIDNDWRLYSSEISLEPGPLPTVFEFARHSSFKILGGITPKNPNKKYDDFFEGEVEFFEEKAVFMQKIRVTEIPLRLDVAIEFQACNDLITPSSST